MMTYPELEKASPPDRPRPVTLVLEWIGECYDKNPEHYARLMAGLRLGSFRWNRERMRLGGNRRPWVARITGLDPKYGLAREFLDGLKDYTESNSVGSRGTTLTFHLYPGDIYEVRHYISWQTERRYFCHVWNGRIIELPRKEVLEYLREAEDRHV